MYTNDLVAIWCLFISCVLLTADWVDSWWHELLC